ISLAPLALHVALPISSPAQFRERVPVFTYEKLFPYIKRSMHGEQNILWPTEITWFSKSSGTTNQRSKFIPVSQEALEECHFKGEIGRAHVRTPVTGTP